jgi:iron complex outermembrane receptor protein
MKYLSLFIILLFTVSNINSQNTLLGTIHDNNNQSIEVTIYIPKLEKGTISDLNGNFKLEQIPNGTFNVLYSSLGYVTISKKITFLNNQSVTQNIIMLESAIEMDEVIISTPFHKLQGENVMKVERLSAKELSKSGIITLSDGISKIPGVTSISTGIGIGKPVIRGLSSNRVLTYTQGVRLENQQFGEEHGLGVNAEGVKSIEVIKGPASLLYGSDAIGGVLYINPEEFANQGQTSASFKSAYFTNTLGSLNTMGFKTSTSKFKFLVRGTYATHSDYKTGDDERVTLSRFNESDIKGGIRYQDSKIKTTLRYNYNQSKIGIPEEIGEQTTSKDMELPYQKIDNHVVSLDTKLFFNKSSLNVVLGYLFNDRNEFEDSMFDPALRLKLNTYNYNVKYNLPDLGNFETLVGIQGMYQINKNFGEEILIPDATKNDFGIMATTHYHFENIGFQGGIRFDTRSIKTDQVAQVGEQEYIPQIDKNFSSFNAALGMNANFSKTFGIRLNFSSGFRAPNLAELASNGVHEGTNRYEIGNSELINEQSFQSDLLIEFENDHFEIYANGFYNYINDYVYLDPTNEIIDENQVYRYTQSNAYLYGGEFGLHIHPHPLDWLHFESSFETVTAKQTNDDYLPLQPANSLSNTIRTEFEGTSFFKNPFFSITLVSTFEQDKTSQFESLTKAYNLLDIGIGSNLGFKKVATVIGIYVNNLTDESYVSHLSRLKADGIANIGRTFKFSLSLSL